MLMKKAIARLICKFGTQLCAVAMVIARGKFVMQDGTIVKKGRYEL
jgi:hypothetical protein